MANPQIQQGTLNRLLASVVYANFTQLNVTSGYLSREAISLAFDGDTSQLIGTLTGAVTSPEPYIYGTVTMHLLRTQGLANAYKQQYETGQLSSSEYKELVNDLNLSNQINQAAEDLNEDLIARQIILGAIQLANAIV